MHRSRHSIFVAAVLVLFCGVAAAASEENGPRTGSIFGVITDRVTGEPMYGASVAIVGLQRGGIAGEKGDYSLDGVPSGTYNLRFSMVGYETLVRSNVTVAPDRATELSVSLAQQAVEMGEVTVKARETYFEEDPEAEVSGKTIDSQEITLSSGGMNDIQRVVQVLPSVTSGSDQINEIIVRGGNFNENLFVMDGIEIPNPNHFSFQGTGAGVVPLLRTEFIDDVSFIAGAFPARYGDKASSVMDISLRRGSRETYSSTLDMSFAGLGFMAEGPTGGNGSFLFSARRSYVDLIVARTGTTAIPNYYNFQGKLSQTFGRHTLLVNAVYGDDSIRIRPDEEDGDEDDDENLTYDTDVLITGLTLRSALAKSLYSEAVLSHVRSNWRTDVWENGDADNRDLYNNRSIESETTLKYTMTWFIGRHDLSGGFSVKNSRFDHNIFAEADTVHAYSPDPLFPDDPERDILTGIGVDYDGDPLVYPDWYDRKKVSTWKRAAFLQARIQAGPRLTLRLGGRYDRMDYNDDSVFAPRLGARLRLADTLYLNGAYGIHYQSPSYINLTANKANRDLEDYHTEQSVLGLEWLARPDLRMTLEGYTKRYRDVPVPRAWTTPDPWDYYEGEMVNAARGRSRGFEFFMQKKMSTSYMFIVSYSNYRAFFTDPRTGAERPWDFDHRNVFTAQGTKRWDLSDTPWYRDMRSSSWYRYAAWLLPFGDEVMLSAKWRFAGGRPFTRQTYLRDYHTWITAETTPMNNGRLDDYHRLDIRLDRRFFFTGWSLDVYLDIMNAYGRDNIWDYTYDEYGERERVSQFSTLPVLGMEFKF